MGLLRWAAIIGTGGLAPVKGTAPRERTAKAAEKQVRLQEQMLEQRQGATTTRQHGATGKSFRISCAYCEQKVWLPIGRNVACPKCHEVMDVRHEGGVPGIRPIRAVRPEAPADDKFAAAKSKIIGT
jgi:hypothetical protein